MKNNTLISRTIHQTKSACHFLSLNKDILYLPLFSCLICCTILLIGLYCALVFLIHKLLWEFVLAILLMASLFIIALYFFHASIIYLIIQRLNGKSCSITDTLKNSSKSVFSIASWAIINSVIGNVISTLETSHSKVEDILGFILGFSWGSATIFVTPNIVMQHCGPIAAFSKSMDMLADIARHIFQGSRIKRRIKLQSFLMFLAFMLIGALCLLAVYFGIIDLAMISLSHHYIIPAILMGILLTIIAIFSNLFGATIDSASYVYYILGNTPEGFSDIDFFGFYRTKTRKII